MKLLITLDFPPAIGGIQKYLYDIVKFQYKSSDMVFVGGIQNKNVEKIDLPMSIRYFYSILSLINPKLSIIKMIIPYYRLIKRYRENITIECGNIYAAIVPWIFNIFLGQSYVVYAYGTELLSLNKKSFKNLILKNILFKAQNIITISCYSKKKLQNIGVKNKIEIFTPTLKLPFDFKISKRKNRNVYTILSVGRLVRHKGHINLLKAAKILLNKEKSFLFSIIGNGPLYNSLIDECKLSQIEKHVLIRQHISDQLLYQEFCKANVFILPSLETSDGVEAFGIVLLEAMAFYVPIIASLSGGIPEVLDNGKCGILVEPGNVDQIVKSILYLKNNPSYTKSLTQKAYKRLTENYVRK